MSIDDDPRLDRSPFAAVAWGVYLAASWTWCIGMFLPVLLARDYGVWGWVVFAAPNVIGAGAMGWVLRDAGASRRVVAHHLPACRFFSMVTVAFHAFFYAWIIRWVNGPERPPYARWGAAYLAVVAAVLLVRRGGWAASGATLAVSTAAAVVLWHRQLIPYFPPVLPGAVPATDLLWLAPVSVFGFALCPYLDLTFHEARQATTRAAGRLAFGVGFGVFFLAMILFTLGYSGWLIHPGVEALPPLLAMPLGAHLLSQTLLKLVLHGRAAAPINGLPGNGLAGAGAAGIGSAGMGQVAAILLSVGAAAGLGTFCRVEPYVYHGLTFGEIAYRGFMAFYGLVFPTYVWIYMVGSGAGEPSPAARTARRLALAGALTVAAPMYWLGFVERKMVWLAPGLAVVLLAKLAVMGRGETRAAVDSARVNAGEN